MIPSQNLNSEFGESKNFSSEIFISIIISRRSKPRRIGIIAPPSSFEKRVVGFAASRHGRLTPLISRELPEGWRTLAASKKTKRDKERLITYAKTVKSRVVRLIENSVQSGQQIFRIRISRQFLYLQFREKNLLSPRLIFSYYTLF